MGSELTLLLALKAEHTTNNPSPPCSIQLQINSAPPQNHLATEKQTLGKYLALHRTQAENSLDSRRYRRVLSPHCIREKAINFTRLKPSDFAPNNVPPCSQSGFCRKKNCVACGLHIVMQQAAGLSPKLSVVQPGILCFLLLGSKGVAQWEKFQRSDTCLRSVGTRKNRDIIAFHEENLSSF